MTSSTQKFWLSIVILVIIGAIAVTGLITDTMDIQNIISGLLGMLGADALRSIKKSREG